MTDSDLCSGEGLWPPERCSNFAYAAYICICVRLSHSSPPLPLFPLLSLPPSVPPSREASPLTGVPWLRLPPSRLQRGFASDRPLATIWYRSAAFLRDDLRNQNRQLY